MVDYDSFQGVEIGEVEAQGPHDPEGLRLKQEEGAGEVVGVEGEVAGVVGDGHP